MTLRPGVGRLRAVKDAVQVFVGTLGVVGIVHWLFGGLDRAIGWPIAENSACLAVPLDWVNWTDGEFAAYGLRWTGFREQLEATVRCALPFSAFALLSFGGWGRLFVFVPMVAGIAALFVGQRRGVGIEKPVENEGEARIGRTPGANLKQLHEARGITDQERAQ
jgi:hypothetical protein